MSTQPVVSKIGTEIAESKTWLQKHTLLIMGVLVIGLSVFVIQKYLDYVVKSDQNKAQIALSQLEAQKASNDKTLAQAQQTLADYKTALDVYSKQNAELTAAITKRTSTAVVQQRQDATLTPTALGTRWKELINKPGITETSTGFSVDDDAGLATVQQLELVPVLEANLSDEQAKEENDQKELGKASAVIDQGKDLVSGLQLQLTDQDKSCKIQLQTEKDKSRKSRLRWFGAGFVTGFIGGIWTRSQF